MIERIQAAGRFFIERNGFHIAPNLVVAEGRQHILSAGLANNTWYFAFFAKDTVPADTWTAVNFESVADEVTEYEGTSRVQWAPTLHSAGILTSQDDLKVITSTHDNIWIWGGAIVSSATKNGNAGVLLAAARFDSPIMLDAGESFRVGYSLHLSAGAAI